MSEITSPPKKMVSRNVAIALGIICIVLVAGLAGTSLFFNRENTNLQNQVNDLTDITYLHNSEILVNIENASVNAEAEAVVDSFYANFSGFLKVDIEPPNTNLRFDVDWEYDGTTFPIRYSESRFQGSNYPDDWKYYPIVASPSEPTLVLLEIYSNSTTEPIITANMTITYYY